MHVVDDDEAAGWVITTSSTHMAQEANLAGGGEGFGSNWIFRGSRASGSIW
jgi:hypothetical protein